MDGDHARVIRERISRAELSDLARQHFGDMVKTSKALLLEDGSVQAEVWGINTLVER